VFVLAGLCGPAAPWLPVKTNEREKIRKAHDPLWKIIRTPQVYQVPCLPWSNEHLALTRFAKREGRKTDSPAKIRFGS